MVGATRQDSTMTLREAKPFALFGCVLGLALGSWNVIAFWLNPLDDSVAAPAG